VESVYLLVPIAALFALGVVGVLVWAVRSGQFDDLESPAHRILTEEETVPPPGSGVRPADGGTRNGAT
jgi:cbb3-type cytochrome oxidase maturation protein